MKRLPAARIAAAGLVLLSVVVWFSGGASAEAPIKQGWWSRWQQGPLPVLGVTLVPPPPTAPSGLTVGREATQETAVAALYFQAPLGADVSLYLAAADPTGVRLPPNTNAVVQACPATRPWDGALNGPWADAPTWSDDFCEAGTVVAGEAGIVWTLPSTMQDQDGALDIVLVPRGQAPYMVNFRATGDETFVVGEAPPSTTTTTAETTTTTEPEPTTTTTTTEPFVEETDPLVVTNIPGTGGGSPGLPAVTTAVPPPPPKTPTSLVAFKPQLPRLPGLPDTRAERIMAVSVLFFMAVAMWWLGGNPTRMPRLIGALAGDGAVVAPPAAPRGVGRFARLRDDGMRPPRL